MYCYFFIYNFCSRVAYVTRIRVAIEVSFSAVSGIMYIILSQYHDKYTIYYIIIYISFLPVAEHTGTLT